MAGAKSVHQLAAYAFHFVLGLCGEMLMKLTVEHGYWLALAVSAPAASFYWLERTGRLAGLVTAKKSGCRFGKRQRRSPLRVDRARGRK